MPPGPIPSTPHQPGRRRVEFAPTHLRVYRDCPEQYYRQYIGNERMPAEFNRSTLRGSAAHKVLARVFQARRDGETVDADLQPLAEQFLPQSLYQKAGALGDWAEDVQTVLRLVAAGLARVPEGVAIVEVEKSFSSQLGERSPAAGATLIGKVDLLCRHPDGFLEQIEFKTGGALPERFQEVICRMGVCAEHEADGVPILSTTVQLTTGNEFPLDGDREVLNMVLAEIEDTITGIWNATTWPARENDRCQFCNYRSTLCSIFGEWSHPNRLEERREERESPAPVRGPEDPR